MSDEKSVAAQGGGQTRTPDLTDKQFGQALDELRFLAAVVLARLRLASREQQRSVYTQYLLEDCDPQHVRHHLGGSS